MYIRIKALGTTHNLSLEEALELAVKEFGDGYTAEEYVEMFKNKFGKLAKLELVEDE